MKIYGNSRSDGFPLFLTLVSAVFIAGGFLLTQVGGVALLAALPVMLALVALMVVRAQRWDVLSDAPVAAGTDTGAPVRLPNYPVKGESDLLAPAPETVWASSSLPAIDKPKSAVETNTAVA